MGTSTREGEGAHCDMVGGLRSVDILEARQRQRPIRKQGAVAIRKIYIPQIG